MTQSNPIQETLEQPTRPRWERRKDARPQELLDAALELFVERGFAATRLEDVAARAGVSKGTLYLYFANKQELFKAVVRENIVPVIGEAEQIVEQFQGPTPALYREIMRGWWMRLGESKLSGIAKLVMSESGNFPEIANFYYEEVIRRGQAMIERLLVRGIERGEFRALDAKVLRQVLAAPVIMLMLWKHSFGPCSKEPVDAQHYIETFIDVSLNGLVRE